jgi:hypothetical protein
MELPGVAEVGTMFDATPIGREIMAGDRKVSRAWDRRRHGACPGAVQGRWVAVSE